MSSRAVIAFSLVISSIACRQDTATISGTYTWGHEVNTLSPCASDSVYWVTAERAVMDTLIAAHGRQSTRPYEGVFVTVRARPSHIEADGFALDYDGILAIVALDEVHDSIPERCR